MLRLSLVQGVLSLKVLANYLERSVPDADGTSKRKNVWGKAPATIIIRHTDVRILASILIEVPEEFMAITKSGILHVIRAFLVARSIAYERIVYKTFFRWMEAIQGLYDGLTGKADIALMRTVALRLGTSVPQKFAYREGYAPVLRHLDLLFSPPEMSATEIEIVKAQVPAPYDICVVPEETWRHVIKNDSDLFRLDHVLRGSWNMQKHITGVDKNAAETEPDAPTLCIVCLDVKPRRMFAMLTCERHLLCASCVLQCRRVALDAGDGGGGSGGGTVTTRCPMRCQYRCTAMPLAAYEYQLREMRARLDFNAVVFGAPVDRKPVELRVGDYIRVRLAGRVRTWVKVDEMLGTTLAVVCADAYPILVLARSDVVLDVIRGDSGSVPLNTLLSAMELTDIEENSQHSITYARRGVEGVSSGHRDVRHFHMCVKKTNKRSGSGSGSGSEGSDTEQETGAWVRVRFPVARLEPSILHSQLEPVYDTLQDLHAVFEETHEILPSMLPSACACMQARGFQLAKQSCFRCRRVVCGSCFGSVSSVCAFCKACDALGPRVLENYSATR